MFNLFTLGLFFVEFSLEFRSHTVIALLGFFEVKSYLVDISESIEVLVLVEGSLFLLYFAGTAVILLNYSLLEVDVYLL